MAGVPPRLAPPWEATVTTSSVTTSLQTKTCLFRHATLCTRTHHRVLFHAFLRGRSSRAGFRVDFEHQSRRPLLYFKLAHRRPRLRPGSEMWYVVCGCGGPPGILYPAGLALMCGYIIIPSYMYISASHSGDSKLMRFSAAFWCLRRGPMIRVEGWGFTQRRERLHDTRA